MNHVWHWSVVSRTWNYVRPLITGESRAAIRKSLRTTAGYKAQHYRIAERRPRIPPHDRRPRG